MVSKVEEVESHKSIFENNNTQQPSLYRQCAGYNGAAYSDEHVHKKRKHVTEYTVMAHPRGQHQMNFNSKTMAMCM